MSDEVILVDCPTCGKEVIWDAQHTWRPFCSKRCKLIDLGEWAAEERRIASQPDRSDSEGWSEDEDNVTRDY